MKRYVVALVAALLFSSLAATSALAAGARPFGVVAAVVASVAADAQANSSRPLLLYFYTSSCAYCKRTKHETLTDQRVTTRLQADFAFHRLNIESSGVGDVAKQLDVAAFPTFVLIDSEGRVVGRLVGFHSAEKFLDGLDQQLKQRLPPSNPADEVENLTSAAMVYDLLELEDLARVTLQRLQMVASGDSDLRAGAWSALADLYHDREEDELAITAYQSFLAIAPNDSRAPRALYYIARLSQSRGDAVRALDGYCQLVSQFPTATYSSRAREKMQQLEQTPTTAAKP